MNNWDSLNSGLIDRLTAQVGDRDMAIAILRKRGHVKPDSEELTDEGRYRETLGAEGRAFDRAGKWPTTGYMYNYNTNKVVKSK